MNMLREQATAVEGPGGKGEVGKGVGGGMKVGGFGVRKRGRKQWGCVGRAMSRGVQLGG